MMYLHLLSLVTLVPEAPCFVFDVTRRQITVGVITWLLLALWFDITHTNKYTHNTNRDNRPTHKYILTAPVMCSQQLSLLHWINRSLILKICFFIIYLLFILLYLCFSRINHLQKSRICLLNSVRLSHSCETQRILIEIM